MAFICGLFYISVSPGQNSNGAGFCRVVCGVEGNTFLHRVTLRWDQKAETQWVSGERSIPD